MTPRRRVASGLVVVAVAGFGTPLLFAAAGSHPRLDAGQREAVVTEARVFFDNPTERMLQLTYSVTSMKGSLLPDDLPGPEPECPWFVEAFSLFGISAGRVLIDCDGNAQRV